MSLEAWGWYGSIFLWLFCTGIGLPPLPEEAGILYAAAVTAVHEEVRWYIAWPATMAGIVCADTMLYGIGRLCGARLFGYRWLKRILKVDRREQIEAGFHGHGMKILLTARLLPPLRTGVFIVAGAIRYSFLRFLIADAGFAVVGVGALFFGGTGIINLLHWAGHWALYAAAAAVGVYALYRYYRYLNARQSKRDPRPPAASSASPARVTQGPEAGEEALPVGAHPVGGRP